MMSWLRRLRFIAWYFHRPPWDSGITPPELVEYIETHPSGRALDLGCGTGTNSITLARAGWNVTGVDFVPGALQQARRKAEIEQVDVNFVADDVSRLTQVAGPFDLALDIGCFHGLPLRQRQAYLLTLSQILVPGGDWLVYLMRKTKANTPGPGLTEEEILGLESHFHLLRREDGRDPRGRLSTWLWLQKTP